MMATACAQKKSGGGLRRSSSWMLHALALLALLQLSFACDCIESCSWHVTSGYWCVTIGATAGMNALQ
jgi:hypothetical protein